jgi:hypothetical protein
MKPYTFLNTPDIVNEGAIRDFLKFNTMCRKAEILRDTKQNMWVKQIKFLKNLLNKGSIDKRTYQLETNKIYDKMSRLELKLSKMNLLPVHY